MVICLEAQAVTAADLGQEHGILARLDFSPNLNQVDLLVDQRGSQMLDRRIIDRSVTQLRAPASETGREGSSVIVAASLAAMSAASLPGMSMCPGTH